MSCTPEEFVRMGLDELQGLLKRKADPESVRIALEHLQARARLIDKLDSVLELEPKRA